MIFFVETTTIGFTGPHTQKIEVEIPPYFQKKIRREKSNTKTSKKFLHSGSEARTHKWSLQRADGLLSVKVATRGHVDPFKLKLLIHVLYYVLVLYK